MKRTLLSLCMCALVFLTGCCTHSQVAASGEMIDNAGTTYARDALQGLIDSGNLNGVICVNYKDGLQEIACLGYADLEAKRPITLDDHFMQCSQTKGFCGVCIAMLVEEGKLNLDDPVSDYLPEFKTLWVRESGNDDVQTLVKAKNTMTVRMCLNHTSGTPPEMPNFQAMGGVTRRMPLRSVAATAAAMPLLFEPGTQMKYSDVGIDIGAAVVEKITGMRWEDFLQERVLGPLEMTETTFWPTEKQLANRIKLYTVTKGQPVALRKFDALFQEPYGDDRVFPSAGGGLWTTARDQYKFYKMLMNLGVGDNGVRILKEETVKSLLAVSSRPKGLGGYSLGLDAPEEDTEEAMFGHGGAYTTNCYVNWHKRLLRMLVLQVTGDACLDVFKTARAAANQFFENACDPNAGVEYTNRLE